MANIDDEAAFLFLFFPAGQSDLVFRADGQTELRLRIYSFISNDEDRCLVMYVPCPVALLISGVPY